MAVASPSSEAIATKPPAMEPSPSRLSSSSATAAAVFFSESSQPTSTAPSSPAISSSSATPDRDDPSNSSPNSQRDLEIQSPVVLRSEEYRQLFRLPPEEVLVEDFNCAFQENILIQGHMYLFIRYICFYSNIFGYETKKLISFEEVTSVRRAKTAGIFPNAIEIFAGGRKYFFASFLSRDEAFKLINDGWLQYSTGATAATDQQDSIPVTSSHENGVAIEKANTINFPVDQLDYADRKIDSFTPNNPEVSTGVENEMVSATVLQEVVNAVEQEIIQVPYEDSPSVVGLIWKLENCDAPKISEGYSKVAESQFPMKVEEFFNCFFSDKAVDFVESFHTKCGDKEFKCNSWYPHEKYGHAREVSFQHPIKIYFGAKFGGCKETQKFRVYRNSHLVVETSQEVSDVPYSDYFCVEGLWDVERGSDESGDCCSMRVYVNVAFTKRTVWKGKIVQSTLEECREAYATWINMAHDLLKKKRENQTAEKEIIATTAMNDEIDTEIEEKDVESSKRLHELRKQQRSKVESNLHSAEPNQQVSSLFYGKPSSISSSASWLKDFASGFCSSLKSQGNLSLVVIIIFFVILLMQLSILVLLARPQQVHVHSPADYMLNLGREAGDRTSEAVVWLEKRVHHLKDEMYMVEARLDRMRNEYGLLKSQLEDLKHAIKRI